VIHLPRSPSGRSGEPDDCGARGELTHLWDATSRQCPHRSETLARRRQRLHGERLTVQYLVLESRYARLLMRLSEPHFPDPSWASQVAKGKSWGTAVNVKLLRIEVGKAFASPPSEPYVRFSRIRLSSRGGLSSRRSRRQPSSVKREQPGFREEGSWPPLVIGTADSHARRLLLLSAKKGA
jgi:hypothetical protein